MPSNTAALGTAWHSLHLLHFRLRVAIQPSAISIVTLEMCKTIHQNPLACCQCHSTRAFKQFTFIYLQRTWSWTAIPLRGLGDQQHRSAVCFLFIVGDLTAVSENQKITNRHYYAHQDQFLCRLFALIMRAKNHADRHSWMTLQLPLTALFLSTICAIFKYILYDYC
jgi:hypothetical protein